MLSRGGLPKTLLGFRGQGLLGGSWVVVSGVIRRTTTAITHMRGLIPPLRTNHEPPSGVQGFGLLMVLVP